MHAEMQRWWRTARTAGARRLSYEILLAVATSVATTSTSLSSEHSSPALVAFIALSTVALVPLRLVFPAGTLVSAALVTALTAEASGPILFVLSVSAGYRIRSLPRTAATFGAVLVCLLAKGRLWSDGAWPLLLLQLAIFLVVQLFPAVIGRMVSQRRQLIMAMRERNAYLRDQQVVVAERARARERARIARELHDSLGNRLTLISLYAGALQGTPQEHRDTHVDLLRNATAAAMGELRQILGILHQEGAEEEIAATPSLDALDELIDAARSTSTRVELHRDGTPQPLPSLIEHAAFRTVQEGLTNALRHARGASIQVTVRYEPDAMIVEVVNGPGKPSHTATTNLGLVGLAERVRLCGGVLYHGPLPDQGFRLAATLPRDTRAPEPRRTLPPEAASDSTTASDSASDDVSSNLHRTANRSRSRLVILALGIVVAFCGLGTGAFEWWARAQTVSRGTYDMLSVGQSQGRAQARLPKGSATVADPTGAPPTPPHAACENYRAASASLLPTSTTVYRFCFRDGRLVAKEAFAHDGN